MAYSWAPALYNSAADSPQVRFIPKPIVDFDLPWQFSFSRHKVPLADGEITFGKSLNGLDITISGSLGIYGNDVDGEEEIIGEDAMWDAVADFATFLDTGGAEQKLELFVYYNDVDEIYRKFKNVRAASFVPRLGDSSSQLWPYTLTLVAEDPSIYSTGPGL